jgi:CRP-like cAMP-binding protein
MTRDELSVLASRARTITLGPTERIIIQGNPGSSLFVLEDGELEVIVRSDGAERQLAILQPGAIVGELAFLTGEPRSATVRAVESATVIEIAARHLEPLVQARPAIIEELTGLMTKRRDFSEAQGARTGLLKRVSMAIFGR